MLALRQRPHARGRRDRAALAARPAASRRRAQLASRSRCAASAARFEALPAQDVEPGTARLLARRAAARAPHRRRGRGAAPATAHVLVRTDPDARRRSRRRRGTLVTNRRTARWSATAGGRRPRSRSRCGSTRQRAIVAARKPLDACTAADGVVRRAFTVAAIAGLAGALLVGVAARRAPRAPASGACATRRCGSPSSGPDAELEPATAAATRSATSAARSPRCRRACASRSRRGARSSRPHRTSCARRSRRCRSCSTCSTRTCARSRPTSRRARPGVQRRGAGAAALVARRRPAGPQPHRRRHPAAHGAGRGRRDRALGRRRASCVARPGARDRARRQRRRLGGRRPGQRRADRADPARQRARPRRVGRAGARARRARRRDGARRRGGPTGRGSRPTSAPASSSASSAARTPSEGGFGLGLAIGRELARRMDGDLALEGEPPRCALRAVAGGRAVAVSR